MRIIWFSRHLPLQRQIQELKRLFGEDVQIIQDPRPFSNAEDIIQRFRKMEGDEMVVVAPLSVLGKLCELGLKPLWAEMQQVSPDQAEVIVNGRGYRFVKFRRIKRLALEFEDI